MGACFPIFAFLTGDIIDSFGEQEIMTAATNNLYKNLVVGGLAFVMGFTMFSAWTISGERQAVKCRKEYFRSILRQEIAWFDLQEQS